MRKLKPSTIGNLLGVYTHMDYYESCEMPTEDDHSKFDTYPDFYSELNKENMDKLKEFAKQLKWNYNYI